MDREELLEALLLEEEDIIEGIAYHNEHVCELMEELSRVETAIETLKEELKDDE